MGPIAGVRIGKYNLRTSAGKCKVSVRFGKYKLSARAGRYKLRAMAGKCKLWDRASKYKLRTMAGDPGQGRGPSKVPRDGKYKDPEIAVIDK